MVRGRNIREGRYPPAGSSFGIITNFFVLRCCCRSNMAALCPGHTMFRTRWRCSMRAAWPSAAAPFSSWSMTLKHLAACWGTRQQKRKKASKLMRLCILNVKKISPQIVFRQGLCWSRQNASSKPDNIWNEYFGPCMFPGGSLQVTEQISGSESIGVPSRAGARKWLICSRFCPANATTRTWCPKTAASPVPNPESVSRHASLHTKLQEQIPGNGYQWSTFKATTYLGSDKRKSVKRLWDHKWIKTFKCWQVCFIT